MARPKVLVSFSSISMKPAVGRGRGCSSTKQREVGADDVEPGDGDQLHELVRVAHAHRLGDDGMRRERGDDGDDGAGGVAGGGRLLQHQPEEQQHGGEDGVGEKPLHGATAPVPSTAST